MRNKVYAFLLETPPAVGRENVLASPYWYGYKNPTAAKPAYIVPSSSQHAAWLAGVHNREMDEREAAAKAKGV